MTFEHLFHFPMLGIIPFSITSFPSIPSPAPSPHPSPSPAPFATPSLSSPRSPLSLPSLPSVSHTLSIQQNDPISSFSSPDPPLCQCRHLRLHSKQPLPVSLLGI